MSSIEPSSPGAVSFPLGQPNVAAPSQTFDAMKAIMAANSLIFDHVVLSEMKENISDMTALVQHLKENFPDDPICKIGEEVAAKLQQSKASEAMAQIDQNLQSVQGLLKTDYLANEFILRTGSGAPMQLNELKKSQARVREILGILAPSDTEIKKMLSDDSFYIKTVVSDMWDSMTGIGEWCFAGGSTTVMGAGVYGEEVALSSQTGTLVAPGEVLGPLASGALVFVPVTLITAHQARNWTPKQWALAAGVAAVGTAVIVTTGVFTIPAVTCTIGAAGLANYAAGKLAPTAFGKTRIDERELKKAAEEILKLKKEKGLSRVKIDSDAIARVDKLILGKRPGLFRRILPFGKQTKPGARKPKLPPSGTQGKRS
jgi:hypothetical protein